MASKPGISERPTEAFLVEWLDALGNWKKLGLFLNISQAHIERIAERILIVRMMPRWHCFQNGSELPLKRHGGM